MEKDYNEINKLTNKQSIEEVFVQKVEKTTIQIFYDKCLFNAFPNAYEVLKDFFFVDRRRPDPHEVKDVIQ